MTTLRVTVGLFVLLLAAAACSSDAPSAPEPGSAESSSASGQEPDDAVEPNDASNTGSPAETSDDCAAVATSATAEDPWLGLEDSSTDPGFAQIATSIRNRTDHMTEPSSDSCTGFAVVDRGVVATDFGALAVQTYEHEDPYVRFDVFVYESQDARDGADAFTVIEQELPNQLPQQYQYLLLAGQGQAVVVARSHEIGDNGFPPNEVGWIASDYGGRITGFE